MTVLCDSFFLFRKYKELIDELPPTSIGGGAYRDGNVVYNADGTVTIDESTYDPETSVQGSASYAVGPFSTRPALRPNLSYSWSGLSAQGHRIAVSVDVLTDGPENEPGCAVYFRVFRSDGSRVDDASSSQITRTHTRGDWERLTLSFDAVEPDIQVVHVNIGNVSADIDAGSRVAVHHLRNVTVTVTPLDNSRAVNTPPVSLYKRVPGDYEWWWYPDGRAELLSYHPGVTAEFPDSVTGMHRSGLISYLRPFDFTGAGPDVVNVGQADTTDGWLACGNGTFRFYARSQNHTANCRLLAFGRWRQ